MRVAPTSVLSSAWRGFVDHDRTINLHQCIEVPYGLIHDWIGVLCIPSTSLSQTLAVVQDYDNHRNLYKPEVSDSKLLQGDGASFKVFLQFYKKTLVLASLSRVDGLIWLDSQLRLKAFGVEITVQNKPKNAVMAQNSQSTKSKTLNLDDYGTRHRSMLPYCASSPNTVGFVVSQDGDVRAITNLGNRVVL